MKKAADLLNAFSLQHPAHAGFVCSCRLSHRILKRLVFKGQGGIKCTFFFFTVLSRICLREAGNVCSSLLQECDGERLEAPFAVAAAASSRTNASAVWPTVAFALSVLKGKYFLGLF